MATAVITNANAARRMASAAGFVAIGVFAGAVVTAAVIDSDDADARSSARLNAPVASAPVNPDAAEHQLTGSAAVHTTSSLPVNPDAAEHQLAGPVVVHTTSSLPVNPDAAERQLTGG